MATMAATSRGMRPARASRPGQLAQLLVHKIAIGLGDFAAHRQVAQRRGIPDFDLLVVFAPGLARQLEVARSPNGRLSCSSLSTRKVQCVRIARPDRQHRNGRAHRKSRPGCPPACRPAAAARSPGPARPCSTATAGRVGAEADLALVGLEMRRHLASRLVGKAAGRQAFGADLARAAQGARAEKQRASRSCGRCSCRRCFARPVRLWPW